ncbi:MAG: hypothetical protein METHSR3v1_1910005 [Methanothrix sp.]|nr:MAG: hypothetical protein METHSR3v1_1910005 [Methanothrix sp.]
MDLIQIRLYLSVSGNFENLTDSKPQLLLYMIIRLIVIVDSRVYAELLMIWAHRCWLR